jgi:hypothetical protein
MSHGDTEGMETGGGWRREEGEGRFIRRKFSFMAPCPACLRGEKENENEKEKEERRKRKRTRMKNEERKRRKRLGA